MTSRMLSFSFCCLQISATSSKSRSASRPSSVVMPTAADFSANRAASLYLFTAVSSFRKAGSRHWKIKTKLNVKNMHGMWFLVSIGVIFLWPRFKFVDFSSLAASWYQDFGCTWYAATKWISSIEKVMSRQFDQLIEFVVKFVTRSCLPRWLYEFTYSWSS